MTVSPVGVHRRAPRRDAHAGGRLMTVFSLGLRRWSPCRAAMFTPEAAS